MCMLPPRGAAAPASAAWTMVRHPRSAGQARKRMCALADEWRLPAETADSVVLLLSELVANAVRHSRVRGRRLGVLCEARAGGVLRVEVSDAGGGLPAIRRASAEDESGRGLALVAAVADRWGVCPRAYNIGKTVWFEVESAFERGVG